MKNFKKPKYSVGDLVIVQVILASAYISIWLEQYRIIRAFYDFGRKTWIYTVPDDNITKEYKEKDIISVYKNGKWL